MPDRVIVAYYAAVAEKILPFLRGRRVGVRHMFDSVESPRATSRGDHTFVFRRHPPPSLNPFMGKVGWLERNWIYIPDKKTLLEIVRQHGYEFFPHLEGINDFWFALDIDVRAVPLPLGKLAVRTALDVLDERGVKYLLKFSGGNGFHVHWAFSPREAPSGAKWGRPAEFPRNRWRFARRIVRSIRGEVERRLQASSQRAAFYRHIPKGDPITELNAMDKEAQKSILFDELILKRQATIRAPFSVHMERRWVAVPLEPRRLEAFLPATDATKAKAAGYARARLPMNPVALFERQPWTR